VIRLEEGVGESIDGGHSRLGVEDEHLLEQVDREGILVGVLFRERRSSTSRQTVDEAQSL
jgi:hypothetical protein